MDVLHVDQVDFQSSFDVIQRLVQQEAPLDDFPGGRQIPSVYLLQDGEDFLVILLAHLPEELVEGEIVLVLLLVGSVENGIVEFAVGDSAGRRHGKFGGCAGLNHWRMGHVGECHQQADVILDVSAKQRENRVEDVGMHRRRPDVVECGHEVDGVNLIDSELLLEN